MRESRRTEKMHLPRDSTEIWLESQTPTPVGTTKHKIPPKDSLEAWIKRRVGESMVRERRVEEK